jgi:hypothetical protein
MKKYPAIKFILITVVSGICGAVLSFLLSFQQAALVSAIQSLSRLLGSALPALHLSVCLFLSGMSVFFTSKLRRQIARSNPQNQEELFEQIESNDHCTEILTINTLSVILNFFFLGVSFVYKKPAAHPHQCRCCPSLSDAEHLGGGFPRQHGQADEPSL